MGEDRIIGNRVKIPDDPVTVIRENSRKMPLFEAPPMRDPNEARIREVRKMRRRGNLAICKSGNLLNF